jgi:hypothetical protein
LFSLDSLDEANICSSVRGNFKSGNGLIHPQHLGRVSAADNDLFFFKKKVTIRAKWWTKGPTKSEPPGIESRASTAARMRVANSSRDTTCLPRRCPHRLVWTWSSICNPATPALAYLVTVRAMLAGPPKPVSASAITGTVGSRLQTISAA